MSSALLCINLINDMVHPDGKMSQERGYKTFAEKHDTVQRVARVQEQFRQLGLLVIHSRLAFSPGYPELPKDAGFLNTVKDKSALVFGTWGSSFHEELGPEGDEPQMSKQRFSPFYRTRLELILQSQNVHNLYICGCSTNLAVETATREAYDRDFNVTVIADGCIAGNDEKHERALKSMEHFAEVKNFADIAVRLTML